MLRDRRDGVGDPGLHRGVRVVLTMSLSAPHAFSEPLNRTAALYFAVTLFSTVGLGDIAPVSRRRAVVTVQMVART
jgi:hypothetical protein